MMEDRKADSIEDKRTPIQLMWKCLYNVAYNAKLNVENAEIVAEPTPDDSELYSMFIRLVIPPKEHESYACGLVGLDVICEALGHIFPYVKTTKLSFDASLGYLEVYIQVGQEKPVGY